MSLPERQNLHATVVAVGENGVLITGASGSGKSALALELLARGGALVADDRADVALDGDRLVATCPEPLIGMIEARGVGILRVTPQKSARIVLVVDMDTTETERMPSEKTVQIVGKTLPLLHNVALQHFPAAIIQYLRVSQS